jgi:hypothetical protein
VGAVWLKGGRYKGKKGESVNIARKAERRL